MSVTLSAVIENGIRLIDGEPVVTYEEIYPEGFDRTPVVDPEYPEYGAIAPQNPYSINVSNVNWGYLLTALGLEELDEESRWCGSFTDLQDMLLRCQALQATLVQVPQMDQGTPDTFNPEGFFGIPEYVCGTREGYLGRQLPHIIQIIEVAMQKGAILAYN